MKAPIFSDFNLSPEEVNQIDANLTVYAQRAILDCKLIILGIASLSMLYLTFWGYE